MVRGLGSAGSVLGPARISVSPLHFHHPPRIAHFPRHLRPSRPTSDSFRNTFFSPSATISGAWDTSSYHRSSLLLPLPAKLNLSLLTRRVRLLTAVVVQHVVEHPFTVVHIQHRLLHSQPPLRLAAVLSVALIC